MLYVQKRKWSLHCQCWLWCSKEEFPPCPSPMCALAPCSILSREQDYSLQDSRKSSVSLIIPITITACMRENNKQHSAFMSCLQWLSFRGLNVSCTLHMNTLIWPLSIFSIKHLSFLSPSCCNLWWLYFRRHYEKASSFSNFDYNQNNFFSWAAWLLLWTWLSHSHNFQQWCICFFSSWIGDTEELQGAGVMSPASAPLWIFTHSAPRAEAASAQEPLPAQTGARDVSAKELAGSWTWEQPARLALLPSPSIWGQVAAVYIAVKEN